MFWHVANGSGQCDIPARERNVTYVGAARAACRILHSIFENGSLTFTALNGGTACIINCSTSDRLSVIYVQLTRELGNDVVRFHVVLPAGELLSAVLSRDPQAELGPFLNQ